MTSCQGQVSGETNLLGEMWYPVVTAHIPHTNAERTRSIQREEWPIPQNCGHRAR